MTHIVNISGGKDSQATALVAAERGIAFRLVMADTGNENDLTIDHAHYVADFLGVPLEVYRYDFSEKIAKKREFVQEKWPEHGVSAANIERALQALQPTGNPFLDLCIWKGRFPSRRAQFCTEWLKSRTISEQVVDPALQRGRVVQWLGVRRDESMNRRDAPMFQKVRRSDMPHDMLLFRPLIHWTAENVFSFTAAKGMKHNPLYTQGMSRVGCFPCINANKAELRQIGSRFPEAIEKIMEWEELVKAASKWGAATFFASDTTPQGAALGRQSKAEAARYVRLNHPEADNDEREYERLCAARLRDLSAAAPWPRADEVFGWAETDRGGKQLNWLMADEGVGCSSEYGLCE